MLMEEENKWGNLTISGKLRITKIKFKLTESIQNNETKIRS